MFCQKSYREYSKETLIDELERFTTENWELKIKLHDAKSHLRLYQHFVNKYEQSLKDMGAPEEDFLPLDIPF